MANYLSLVVLSPVNTILKADQVKSLRVRLKGDTWLSIYPGHAPLLAELISGKMTYETDDFVAEHNITSAILQVSKNQISLFVNDSQDFSGDINKATDFDSLARKLMQTMVNQDIKKEDTRY